MGVKQYGIYGQNCRGGPDGKTSIRENTHCSMLEEYKGTPVFITMDITEDVVESFLRKLWGSAGPCGMDLEGLHGWLLKFGDYSKKIVLVWNI